jgi:hypothetical protein
MVMSNMMKGNASINDEKAEVDSTGANFSVPTYCIPLRMSRIFDSDEFLSLPAIATLACTWEFSRSR